MAREVTGTRSGAHSLPPCAGSIFINCVSLTELEYRVKRYYKKNHSLLPLPPAPFPSPPPPAPLPLPSYFFLKAFHYVAQAGLEVESAGVTGIPIIPSGIIPLTEDIVWDTPPHTHPFLKKEPLALSNCLTPDCCMA